MKGKNQTLYFISAVLIGKNYVNSKPESKLGQSLHLLDSSTFFFLSDLLCHLCHSSDPQSRKSIYFASSFSIFDCQGAEWGRVCEWDKLQWPYLAQYNDGCGNFRWLYLGIKHNTRWAIPVWWTYNSDNKLSCGSIRKGKSVYNTCLQQRLDLC